MTEETSFLTKAGAPSPATAAAGESMFLGMTVRAWLAGMILGTLCLNESLVCFASLYIRHVEYVPSNQLYGIAIMVVTFYYAKKSEPAIPPNTEIKSTSTVETKTP